jgi:D-glycero-D-manno-heptose 1,7-bisphosphate phosphatase
LPGLIEQVADRFGIDVKDVPFVGDSLRDMQAAAAAGCAPHLVLTGKSQALRGASLPPTFPAGTQMHTDLNAFVDALLKKTPEHAL